MGGPTFLVETPATRISERDYVLSVLLEDWLGAAIDLRRRSGADVTTISVVGGPADSVVALPDVFLGPATAWLSSASLPAMPLSIASPPAWTGLSDQLPLLYPSPSAAGGIVEGPPGQHRLGFDLLGAMFVLLSGYEARVEPASRDAHGRFPGADSFLARSDWLAWPILDMYLHAFVALLNRTWPRLNLRLQPGTVSLSHDVDHPSAAARWHGMERVRTLAGDLLRRRDPVLAMRRGVAFVAGTRSGRGVDPFDTFGFLMDVSEDVGLESTFYFLGGSSHLPYGSRYTLSEPWVARLLYEIASRGHHVALHGSYLTWRDALRLRGEWDTLAEFTRALPNGVVRRAVRQHFLRLEPGSTWRTQSEAGLEEDASYGYPDLLGFRAGTARSFMAYDVSGGGRLPLRVSPLHVMDATLTEYLRLDGQSARAKVVELSRRTQRYGGTFSLLWHNSTLETRRARRLYQGIIDDAVR